MSCSYIAQPSQKAKSALSASPETTVPSSVTLLRESPHSCPARARHRTILTLLKCAVFRLKDFQDGNLLPVDAAESANGSDSKYVKVDPSVLDRYELRAGDIVMPRMLGRSGASNLLVVSAADAKQHLVASHNTTVIRPSFQTMTEEERVVFSEIIVGYLTEGHGAQLLQALTEAARMRAIRPSDPFEIEVPAALDPRTREYSESINRFAKVVKAKETSRGRCRPSPAQPRSRKKGRHSGDRPSLRSKTDTAETPPSRRQDHLPPPAWLSGLLPSHGLRIPFAHIHRMIKAWRI